MTDEEGHVSAWLCNKHYAQGDDCCPVCLTEKMTRGINAEVLTARVEALERSLEMSWKRLSLLDQRTSGLGERSARTADSLDRAWKILELLGLRIEGLENLVSEHGDRLDMADKQREREAQQDTRSESPDPQSEGGSSCDQCDGMTCRCADPMTDDGLCNIEIGGIICRRPRGHEGVCWYAAFPEDRLVTDDKPDADNIGSCDCGDWGLIVPGDQVVSNVTIHTTKWCRPDEPAVPEWRALVDCVRQTAENPLAAVLRDVAYLAEGGLYERNVLARIVAIAERQVGNGWKADPDGIVLERLAQWLIGPLSRNDWWTLANRAAAWLASMTEADQ